MKRPARNILVLCHGNINRSAACAAVLRKHGLQQVRSAALKEYTPREDGKLRATLKMREEMALHGYDLEEHRALRVTRDMVDWADVIIYMDNGNRKRFEAAFPDAVEKLRCLASWTISPAMQRIPDPNYMARGSEPFKSTVDTIIRASKLAAEDL